MSLMACGKWIFKENQLFFVSYPVAFGYLHSNILEIVVHIVNQVTNNTVAPVSALATHRYASINSANNSSSYTEVIEVHPCWRSTAEHVQIGWC